MYAKAAKTMAFYAKRGLNLQDVFMTKYTSIYYEKANSCCFYVLNSKKTCFMCKVNLKQGNSMKSPKLWGLPREDNQQIQLCFYVKFPSFGSYLRSCQTTLRQESYSHQVRFCFTRWPGENKTFLSYSHQVRFCFTRWVGENKTVRMDVSWLFLT